MLDTFNRRERSTRHSNESVAARKRRLARLRKAYADDREDRKKANAVYYQSLEGHYNILKQSAKRRSIELTLVFEEYKQLVENRYCIHCGGSLPPMGHGLDRIDSNKGYIPENCVPCCWPCNDRLGAMERIGFTRARALELLRELVCQQTESKL